MPNIQLRRRNGASWRPPGENQGGFRPCLGNRSFLASLALRLCASVANPPAAVAANRNSSLLEFPSTRAKSITSKILIATNQAFGALALSSSSASFASCTSFAFSASSSTLKLLKTQSVHFAIENRRNPLRFNHMKNFNRYTFSALAALTSPSFASCTSLASFLSLPATIIRGGVCAATRA